MIWALVIVILALTGLIGYKEYLAQKERAKFINALVGKNAGEVASLDLSDKTKIKVESKEPEFIPTEQLPEEEFAEAIKKEVNGR